MGKRKSEPEPPKFPTENKICGILFICEMMAVLSAVSMVYLTVASYVPSLRALDMGIDETPIMCTTLTAGDTVEGCLWGSCGEWCLSKSTGGTCMQIWVQARQNGSTLRFEQCTETTDRLCEGITDPKILDHYNCRKDECKKLEGLFNCTEGVCRNVTDYFQCNMELNGPPFRCLKRETCFDMKGLFTCDDGNCFQGNRSYDCEKLCPEISSKNKNVVILNGDRNVLANCQQVVNADTNETVWSNALPPKLLMISCHTVKVSADKKTLEATDCLNATLNSLDLLGDRTNFSVVTKVHKMSTDWLPSAPSGFSVPSEPELVMVNKTRLLINLEACVNSLRDECKEFYGIYGRDGSDYRSPARFPCLHSTIRPDFVVTKFSMKQTMIELVLTTTVPMALFVISCSVMVICSKVVVVGNDAHLTFTYIKNKEDTELALNETEPQTNHKTS